MKRNLRRHIILRLFYLAVMGVLLIGNYLPLVWARTGRPVLRINQVDTTQPPAVRVYLTDLDSSGTPVTDRKPQNYRLLVDGIPQTGAQQIKPFFQAGEPLVLTLVIQVSPSMRDIFTEAVEASKKLIESLPTGSKIGLVAYADVVVSEIKPTTLTGAREALDALRIREEALEIQLPNAVRDALEGLDGSNLPRQRFIVLLSDGISADMNFMVFSELGGKAQDKGVQVHSVGFALLEPGRLRTLEELSKRSNGTFRETTNTDGLTKAFSTLQEELRQQILLTYPLPKFFDGKLHDFQIETPAGQASNILSLELSRLSASVETKSKASSNSTWVVIFLLVLGQAALVALILIYLRWRQRSATMAKNYRWSSDSDDDEKDIDDEEEEIENGEDQEDEEEEDEQEEPATEDRRTGRRIKKQGAPNFSERRTAGSRIKDSRRQSIKKSALERAAALEEGARRNIEDFLAPEGGAGSPSRVAMKPKPEPSLKSFHFSGVNNPPSRPPTFPSLPGGGGEPPPPVSLPDSELIPDAISGNRDPWASAPGAGGEDIPFRLPLPDPDDFLKNPNAASVPSASENKGQSKSAELLLPLPDPADFLMRAASPPSEDTPPKMPGFGSDLWSPPPPTPSGLMPAIHSSDILDVPRIPPGKEPSLVPLEIAPDAGVQPGRYLDRRTRVLGIEEMGGVESVAWVVELGASFHRTYVLNEGFTIGSDPKNHLVLKSDLDLPYPAVFHWETRGYRLETQDDRGEKRIRLLNDDDHFLIGDHEFIYKIAHRNPPSPVAMIRLEVLDGMDQGRKLSLKENKVYTIGAHPTCDLILRGDGVEKIHAVVVRKDRACLISDLGSRQGLWSQGEQVGSKKVLSGEEVSVANLRLLYVFEERSVKGNEAEAALLQTLQAPKMKNRKGSMRR